MSEDEREPMRIYATRAEAIERAIAPELSEYVADFDLRAIADGLLVWHEETDEAGNIMLNLCGLRVRQDLNFWEVAARHERVTGA